MTHAPPNHGIARRGGPPSPAKRRLRKYLPPQHGAWAMLLVPFVVALLTAGANWLQVPLLLAWLAGYLLSYYALLALKTRRPARVRAQLRLYAAITVPAALVVVVLRPEVLWFAPAYAALLAVNAWYAWHHRDRALTNDLASVLQGTLMVPVAATVAGVSLLVVVEPFAIVLLYFIGTVVFVKTMIRERGDASYLRASIGFHVAATVLAGLIVWPWAILFAWFALRAAWLPRYAMTPKDVGLVEIGNCVALLAMTTVLWS
ncbi:YwiC-like family protein [Pengzhenrongella phosphoraccumulans]|uniref:YwiC-like family protein n=1 Tax=Pengzhenrongella phosphoraccumulans TaxID=3114394 RepID=UPI00388DCC14